MAYPSACVNCVQRANSIQPDRFFRSPALPVDLESVLPPIPSRRGRRSGEFFRVLLQRPKSLADGLLRGIRHAASRFSSEICFDADALLGIVIALSRRWTLARFRAPEELIQNA
jgi:hypothetical protein